MAGYRPDVGPFPVGTGTRPRLTRRSPHTPTRQTGCRAPAEAASGAGRPGAAISARRRGANANTRASTNTPGNTAGAGQGR